MKKDFYKIVINLNQNEINDLLDYFNEARKETLKEVEKIIDNFEKDSSIPIRTEDIINNKVIIADYIKWDKFRKLKQEINKLKEDLKK